MSTVKCRYCGSVEEVEKYDTYCCSQCGTYQDIREEQECEGCNYF